MIEYPDYVTREEIQSLLEDLFNHNVYNLAEEADAGIEVRIDRDLVPRVKVSTFDDYILVDVETREIVSSDGNPGYEFIPTINNAGINETFDLLNHDDIVDRFKRWAKIAKFADELYCTEFYPLDYIDE